MVLEDSLLIPFKNGWFDYIGLLAGLRFSHDLSTFDCHLYFSINEWLRFNYFLFIY